MVSSSLSRCSDIYIYTLICKMHPNWFPKYVESKNGEIRTQQRRKEHGKEIWWLVDFLPVIYLISSRQIMGLVVLTIGANASHLSSACWEYSRHNFALQNCWLLTVRLLDPREIQMQTPKQSRVFLTYPIFGLNSTSWRQLPPANTAEYFHLSWQCCIPLCYVIVFNPFSLSLFRRTLCQSVHIW